jgi:hypothetical protein
VLLWGSVKSMSFMLYDFEEEAMPSLWDSKVSPISALAMFLGQHGPIFVRSLQVNQFSGLKHLTIDWGEPFLLLHHQECLRMLEPLTNCSFYEHTNEILLDIHLSHVALYPTSETV